MLGVRSASSPQLPDDCSFTFEMYTTSAAYDGILRKQSIEVSGGTETGVAEINSKYYI